MAHVATSGEGERQEERRACSLGGLKPEAPPMPLDEFSTEEESQTGTRNLTGARILRPHKPSKNMGLLPSGNANAPIANGNERGVWLSLFADDEFDGPSLRAVLDGITQ